MDLSVFLLVSLSICSNFPRTITAARVTLMLRKERSIRRRNKILSPVFLLSAQEWRREGFFTSFLIVGPLWITGSKLRLWRASSHFWDGKRISQNTASTPPRIWAKKSNKYLLLHPGSALTAGILHTAHPLGHHSSDYSIKCWKITQFGSNLLWVKPSRGCHRSKMAFEEHPCGTQSVFLSHCQCRFVFTVP